MCASEEAERLAGPPGRAHPSPGRRSRERLCTDPGSRCDPRGGRRGRARPPCQVPTARDCGLHGTAVATFDRDRRDARARLAVDERQRVTGGVGRATPVELDLASRDAFGPGRSRGERDPTAAEANGASCGVGVDRGCIRTARVRENRVPEIPPTSLFCPGQPPRRRVSRRRLPAGEGRRCARADRDNSPRHTDGCHSTDRGDRLDPVPVLRSKSHPPTARLPQRCPSRAPALREHSSRDTLFRSVIAPRGGTHGTPVGEGEHLDHGLSAMSPVKRRRLPATVGQYVVRSGTTGRDQLIPHLCAGRTIGDAIAVQVPELAASETELGPAEPMRSRLDARPERSRRPDLLRPASACPRNGPRAAPYLPPKRSAEASTGLHPPAPPCTRNPAPALGLWAVPAVSCTALQDLFNSRGDRI